MYRQVIRIFHLIFIVTGLSGSGTAQTLYTGFEGLSDEAVFSQQEGAASWLGQGFETPWVEGFDQDRAHIDNAYSKEGSNSLRIFYPKNNFGTKNTGAQAPLLLKPAEQYCISYWLRFSEDFSWGTTSEGDFPDWQREHDAAAVWSAMVLTVLPHG